MNEETPNIVWSKNGYPVIPITGNLFIGGDGKLTRGNYDDPDDCPRCKFRKGCPYGMPGLGMHRCNQGIFEAEK